MAPRSPWGVPVLTSNGSASKPTGYGLFAFSIRGATSNSTKRLGNPDSCLSDLLGGISAIFRPRKNTRRLSVSVTPTIRHRRRETLNTLPHPWDGFRLLPMVEDLIRQARRLLESRTQSNCVK